VAQLTVVASILAQHMFSCALVTRGALCDCYPTAAEPDLLAALAATRGRQKAGSEGQ